MLARVRHSPTLALTCAHFGGVANGEDFSTLAATLAGATADERLADQLLIFEPLTAFDPCATDGFRAYLRGIAETHAAPVALSCALVGADPGTRAALEAWARMFPTVKACRAIVSVFSDWVEAALWTGMDESGVAAIRAMRDFRFLYPV